MLLYEFFCTAALNKRWTVPVQARCMISVVSDAAQHAMGLAWSNRRPGGLTGGNAARRVTPTLEALPLRTGAVPAALLASGSWSAVVLSEHGNRLETLQFPVNACNGTNSKHEDFYK